MEKVLCRSQGDFVHLVPHGEDDKAQKVIQSRRQVTSSAGIKSTGDLNMIYSQIFLLKIWSNRDLQYVHRSSTLQQTNKTLQKNTAVTSKTVYL